MRCAVESTRRCRGVACYAPTEGAQRVVAQVRELRIDPQAFYAFRTNRDSGAVEKVPSECRAPPGAVGSLCGTGAPACGFPAEGGWATLFQQPHSHLFPKDVNKISITAPPTPMR